MARLPEITRTQYKVLRNALVNGATVAEAAKLAKMTYRQARTGWESGWLSPGYEWALPIGPIVTAMKEAQASGDPELQALADPRRVQITHKLLDIRREAAEIIGGNDSGVASIALTVAARDPAMRMLLIAEKGLIAAEPILRELPHAIEHLLAEEKDPRKLLALLNQVIKITKDAITSSTTVTAQMKNLGMVPEKGRGDDKGTYTVGEGLEAAQSALMKYRAEVARKVGELDDEDEDPKVYEPQPKPPVVKKTTRKPKKRRKTKKSAGRTRGRKAWTTWDQTEE